MNKALALNLASESATLLTDVLEGLGRSPKEIPCKYFYDERGSHLFDKITELEEYYLTRTELAIIHGAVDEMAAALGPGCLVLEYGSGSSRKTEVLLDALEHPVAYVPVEISRKFLAASAERLRRRFPALEILPVCADYTDDYPIPQTRAAPRRRVVFFPGSTIGNFGPAASLEFLGHLAEVVGNGGGLLIGVDLDKDREVLERAYNDGQGVTAAFNLNLLVRINRELDADFNLDAFRHRAIYNVEDCRIETYLVSQEEQTVHVAGESFHFGRGETIWTEHSYKYTLEGFAKMARRAGLEVERVWTDDAKLFSVQYLRVI